MYNKSLILTLCIVYFFQIIYTYNINETILYTYNNITTHPKAGNFIYTYKSSLSKERVLNITDEFYGGYFCKNDICVSMDYLYKKPFIEIPDKNGNINLYISQTYSYEYLKLYNPRNKNCYDNTCISFNCNSDSECLYNKCVDNYCMFNDEAPVVHCDNIYLGHRKSYTYCGKAYGDICNNDDECSSRICSGKGQSTCNSQTNGPSDSETMPPDSFLYIFYSSCLILIIISIITCCCCYRRRNKKLSHKK
jgi:hypothetical protein